MILQFLEVTCELRHPPQKMATIPASAYSLESLPSRELTYPTLEKENHLQNAIFGGQVSSLEGNFFGGNKLKHPHFSKSYGVAGRGDGRFFCFEKIAASFLDLQKVRDAWKEKMYPTYSPKWWWIPWYIQSKNITVKQITALSIGFLLSINSRKSAQHRSRKNIIFGQQHFQGFSEGYLQQKTPRTITIIIVVIDWACDDCSFDILGRMQKWRDKANCQICTCERFQICIYNL